MSIKRIILFSLLLIFLVGAVSANMDNVAKQTIDKFDEQGYKMIKNESNVYEFQKSDKLAAVGFHDNLNVEDLQKDNYVPFNVNDVDGYYKHEDDGSRTFGYDCNGTLVLITTDDVTLLNHVVLVQNNFLGVQLP